MSREKQVSNIVLQGQGLFSSLGPKIARLNKLTALLKNSLNDPLRQHCQVANLRDDCLVIMTDSAAWATQIRYLIPDLLRQLKRTPELMHIRTLHCYIDPMSTTSNPPAETIQRTPLSEENIKLLNSIGSAREDALGKALRRLAENALKMGM